MNEHGWNDPPVFAYSGLQTKPGGSKRTQLNKRVNHDLSAPSTQAPVPSHSNPDPPLAPEGPPTKPRPCTVEPSQDKPEPHSSEDSCSSCELPESITVDSVVQGLERVMEKHKTVLSDRTITEVKSRLKILVNQWKNGKLSKTVQIQMAKLTTALEDGHYSVADEFHVSLMVDHVGEVSRWMVGVKKLIALLKQQASS